MYDAIMSTMSMTKRSGAVRLARRIGASPAVPAIAMRAPQTGDEARPMEVASSIGRSSVSVGTPSFAATAGVSGPKAKRRVVRRLRADSYKGAMPAAVMQTRKCIFSQHVHLSRPPYRHFERSREIFLALRFSDICILRFTACNRDPSTSLGMTIHAKRYQKLRRSRHLPR